MGATFSPGLPAFARGAPDPPADSDKARSICQGREGQDIRGVGRVLHTKDKSLSTTKRFARRSSQRPIGSRAGHSTSPLPIRLKLFSPTVVPLTLVDLPGLVKNALPGQPADIDVQIKKCVYEYIQKPNAVILAVSAANADLATSDALQAAINCDPKGDRPSAFSQRSTSSTREQRQRWCRFSGTRCTTSSWAGSLS